MKKSIIGSGLLLLLVALIVLGIGMSRKNGIAGPEYRTAPVKRGMLKEVVASTGTINPLNTVMIGSQLSGNIEAIHVDFNSMVKKDQIIAHIDSAVYDAQLEQAKAQLLLTQTQLIERQRDEAAVRASINSAKANLQSAQASFREVDLQLNRIVKLRGNKTVSQSSFDEVQARHDNAKGGVETAKANVQAAEAHLQKVKAQEEGARAMIAERRAAVKLAQIRLDYCTIRSPIDGIVIERAVDVGQTVAASLQSPTLFTIAEDLTHMQLEVDVSEADVGKIQPGQAVEFSVDAFAEKKFKASVQQIRNSPTNIQNVVTYKVIADLENPSRLLRPGMTANVSIIVAHQNDVLMVPNAALRFRPPGAVQDPNPDKPASIKERPLYLRTVKNLELDDIQAQELEKIIAEAGEKLKTALQNTGNQTEKAQSFRIFYTHVFTRLSKILSEAQKEKLQIYIQELRANRANNQHRRAQVYQLGPDGLPNLTKLSIGITDDSDTEIKSGVLREGDEVIVGLAVSSASEQRDEPNALMRIISGRRR